MPSKADVKAWKAQLVAQAEQQILKLTDSGQFKKYLNTLAKFHHYSARNIDLIYAQNPQATQVAGFKQWQTDFNRTVNKGAKSIRIAAPIIKKLTPAEQKRLDTTDERAIVGYRYLPIFDVAQTSGDPVLSAKDFVKENLADHQNVTSLYNAVKDYLNQQPDLKVSEVPLATLNGAKGYFHPSTNEIVIGGDEPDNALKLKTLYHEYAHSQLHGLKSAFKDRPRAYQETQAEAVAYVAMQNIGVDTGNYSLGYVATWAKDKAVIHSALSEIQQVSNKVIELSDGLTKQLGLQEAQKEPEHDLKKLSAQDLNKSYRGLQQQIQQATRPQQKAQFKNQLHDVHQEISERTQKQLKAFAEQNPGIKQPESELDQSLKR
ncbi:ArdC-like ssDNA-binding domain-containing protein [Lactiplantibacillus plantarum]|uniref:ArdC-like ssDNA-binding domain-containing protein n=1 Tax=Lactiplantibacillus plantarum TaxID=1590 RepID=UPI003F52D7B0